MSNQDNIPSKRRSLYQKFSDKVFSITGMPVSRLATIIFGLLILGWAILYATREDETSSEFKSEKTERQDFLAAITLPANFSRSPLPVQIEKLDWMIGRCNYLQDQESDINETLQERLLALTALKAMTMADNDLDPAPALKLFQQSYEQIPDSLTEKDKHLYLAVATYMKVLAANPDSDFYQQAAAAISAIQKTTPVPLEKAKSSFNSAMEYHQESEDKVKSGKLVRFLGERIAMAKDRTVSGFGFSLMDYPNFISCYKGAINQSRSGNALESETIQLLKQIKETPPQSVRTYNVLMNVPEQHLHAGNRKVALRVVAQLTSVASSSPPRISDSVLPKLDRLKTRIELLGNPFPLSGLDAEGGAIGSPQKDQTLIIFINAYKKIAAGALYRVANSPSREEWSTTTYLVSVTDLSDDATRALKNTYPDFILVDGPTSKDWLEKCGIEQVPYLIRLDEAGVVQRLSFP